MVFKNYKLNLSVRTILLFITLMILSLVLFNSQYIMLSTLLLFTAVFQVYAIIRYSEATNREIIRFFTAIENADFTQSSTIKDLGGSFSELANSFAKVTERFLKLRSEKEENSRYLQTVVQHIGTAVIAFKHDGEIVLFNNAAKQILNTGHARNLHSLRKFSTQLTDAMQSIKIGENLLLKLSDVNGSPHLVIKATGFKLQAETYKLISIQDIQSEIERERLGRELEIARHVQASLLPKNQPDINNFDIAGFCLPAREVGGDYFDFIPDEQGNWGIVIGDVSGKGVPAAIYMTLTKGILQSLSNQAISPAEVMKRLNYLLYNSMERGAFVTLFLAILKSDEREITLSRAGHNAAIYYSAQNDRIEFLKPPGIGAGLEAGSIFNKVIQDYRLKMEPADWLVFYTDGFSEALNETNEQYEEERISRCIRNNLDVSAKQMIDAIYADVQHFSGTREQFDDMTMIALKVK